MFSIRQSRETASQANITGYPDGSDGSDGLTQDLLSYSTVGILLALLVCQDRILLKHRKHLVLIRQIRQESFSNSLWSAFTD